MHSVNNLFSSMLSREYIHKCIHLAAKGKRKRHDVVDVLRHEDECIYQVQLILYNGKFVEYVPEHGVFKINDGITKKVRYIVKPTFFEQIIHHMIIGVLKKHIMRGMYEYNCGSVPDRGGEYARKVVEGYIHKHLHDGKIDYCMKLDIHHFFQSIKHITLKKLIMKKVKDANIVLLFDVIINAYFDHIDVDGEKCGLPIGFYTSQWLANWYLQGLDHYIKQVLKAEFYVRYMDDMIIFSESKEHLHYMFDKISEYLENKLGLSLNSKWQIFPFDKRVTEDGKVLKKGRCVDYVGFRFYRDRTVLRKSLLKKYTRKVSKIKKHKDDCNWYVATQAVSYHGWAVRCDTAHLRKQYNLNLKRVTHCISKHKKKLNLQENELNNHLLSILESRKRGVA